MFNKQHLIRNNWYFEICMSTPFSWIACLMKKDKKYIHSIYLVYFYTRAAIHIEASESITTNMKTEFYDCRTTSQKYFGSLRLIDFVSQAFSKNRVLQQNRYWTTCTSTYMIQLKSSMRNKMAIWTDWCCCQDKVPQSKPVHTTIQFPDACSSPWTSTWVRL